MKSICLVHYCPWPADTGTKVEMMKHLNVLKDLGSCTIACTRVKPAGFGWTTEAEAALREQGFELVFREDSERFRPVWLVGFAYATVCNALKLERAFGHSNPYHRFAFSQAWWSRVTEGMDLAVMQYGFWGRLKSKCPQAIAVHELLSSYHYEGHAREVREWRDADLLCVVGHDERGMLEERGLKHVLWSPPAIRTADLPLTSDVGLIGTKAPQNMEGLRWLEQAGAPDELTIKVYGNIASEVTSPMFDPVGRYGANTEPYEACGIHLMTRDDRPGLQIKVVEALAFGRAIVARRGSMRGLPEGEAAWVEVATPAAMLREALALQQDAGRREALALRARQYYALHLSETGILAALKNGYLQAAGVGA